MQLALLIISGYFTIGLAIAIWVAAQTPDSEIEKIRAFFATQDERFNHVTLHHARIGLAIGLAVGWLPMALSGKLHF